MRAGSSKRASQHKSQFLPLTLVLINLVGDAIKAGANNGSFYVRKFAITSNSV
jgi:hypothetical protein